MRSPKKRSLLSVNEHFEGEHNNKRTFLVGLLQYYHYLPCCLFGPLRRYMPKKREPQCNRSSLEKKWRWQCGTVALLATTGTLVPQRSALGYYSPTKLHGGQVRRWRQQLVTRSIAESDAAWGATEAPSPGERALTVLYNKKRTSF